jgi:hypothetical protein
MPTIDFNPKFTRPELLLHGGIPGPLHGTAPRVVLGDKWWQETRSAAYVKNNWCCHACGAKPEVDKPLEAHECYEFDYRKGRATYIETVALCYRCHQFIHLGHTEITLGIAVALKVLDRGVKILAGAGLEKEYYERLLTARTAMLKAPPDNKWRLVIDGKEYKPVRLTTEVSRE